MSNKKAPTLLVILDGYGIAPPGKGNAITLAKKPTIDRLFEMYPSTTLCATGTCVGLPDHKMSGSEAGHMNIGAGRIVLQDSKYITNSIRDGSFFINPAMIGAVNHLKKSGGNFHVMGLMGNGDSPHSDPEHFRAVLKLAKKNGISEVYCHLFTDGRDSYPKSALEHLKYFRRIIKEEGIGKIATLSGRFYAMDRAKNWKRLTLAYDAMVFARGEKANCAEEAIEKAYAAGLTDEYLLPTIILENGAPVARIKKDDSVIFYNFRSDRARQFSKLFIALDKESILNDNMPVLDKIENLYFVALTDFGPGLDEHTAFPEHTIIATLPMVLGDIRQLYIAESEKFAHVTYFFNGGYADPVDDEDRVMIKSPVIDSYAKMPEMSAELITNKVLESLEKNEYDFILINYANADMVGHTGDLLATIKAVEFLDKQIERLVETVLKLGGNLVITADHGNADDMVDFDSEQPNTYHTKNPVPFLIVSEKFKDKKLRDGGVLGNIAPTILDMLEIKKPKLMAKNSLLK
ncbi:MAG: 2,3-bisphosphoglycerate-independent phosphoglycerate mutase [Candidatus Moranbacteria bacterium]|nr:2,3-bisphosphoglycerate-independent phosphoglycerate mutase [Candidatus Moranbacteria bacterium]